MCGAICANKTESESLTSGWWRPGRKRREQVITEQPAKYAEA